MRGITYNLLIKNPSTAEFDLFDDLNMNKLIKKIENYIETNYKINIKITRNKIYNRINREEKCSKLLRDLIKITKKL